MKAMVIGFGSIGQRHVRLLEQMGLDVGVVSRRDIDVGRRFASIDAGLNAWSPDYVVIASRTNEHLGDLQALARNGFAGIVLVEKPLFDHAAPLPENAFRQIYVAYNLRFHPAVMSLKQRLADERAIAVHAYVGQYLPDWRPGCDYREGYSAQKALGGGALRDLSHELDFVTWILGNWRRLTSSGGRLSDLEIDSDDVFSVMMELERCPIATIQMNYLDRRAHRETLVLTNDGTARIDLIAGSVDFDGETTSFDVARDDTYIAQHRAVLEGPDDALCSGAGGLEIVNLIAASERAAHSGIWVER